MNNFRSQWKAIAIPFITTSIAYDQQFWLYNEKLSGGIILIHDRSGDARLQMNKLFISGAYHKSIKTHTLHIGIQTGLVFKSFSMEELTFPDQWDMSSGYFNGDLAHNETIGEQLSYPDLNFGGIWSKKFRKGEIYIGASLFHWNKPKESFYGNDNKLPSRKVMHAGGKIELGKKFFLTPSALFMNHSKATDMLIGSNIGYYVPENNNKIVAVYAGAFLRDGVKRNTDAYVIVAGMIFKNMDVGLSYDVNISDLNVATDSRGGFEISLIYTGISTSPDKITIPCDRF